MHPRDFSADAMACIKNHMTLSMVLVSIPIPMIQPLKICVIDCRKFFLSEVYSLHQSGSFEVTIHDTTITIMRNQNIVSLCMELFEFSPKRSKLGDFSRMRTIVWPVFGLSSAN